MNIFSRTIWEREYIDLWSGMHLIAGFLSSFALFLFHWEFQGSLALFTAGAILWEVAEYYAGVGELPSNQVSDVVVGMIGFVAGYYTIPHLAQTQEQLHWWFAVTIVVVTFYNFIGWYSFKRYSKKKK